MSGTGGTGATGAGGSPTGNGGQGGGGCSCTTIYAPVCGVDGVTYGNSCGASCAGVAIAHQGACADGGAGGAPGSCNSDSDCLLESVGCCGQSCVARNAVAPASTGAPIICNVACPVETDETCACVNHQCVTEAGTGGQGGGAGGAGGGGAGGAGGGPACGDLAQQYAAALPAAESCAPDSGGACQALVSASLSPCNFNCMVYVNDATKLDAIKASWLQQKCDEVLVLCPAIACAQPSAGVCVLGDGGGGRCQTVTGGGIGG
ncbi:MAG TPA: hypothetical protein VHO06_26750 [Polyangia bacterium]|nr:hypothetical protein [Polyangia bacterium]